MTVQEHSGKVIEGETVYDRDTEWKDFLKDYPVTYRDVTGGESVRGRMMEEHTTGLITVPSTPKTRSITQKMRAVVGGVKFNIVSVLDTDGMQRELQIQVSKDVQ